MNRDELRKVLLSRSNPPPVPVEGEPYFARVMTPYDTDVMRKRLAELPKDDGYDTGRVLAFLLCNEEGELLFDAGAFEDVAALSKLPQPVIQAILDTSKAANGVAEGNV